MFARIVNGFIFLQIIILLVCGYVSALHNVTTVTLVEQTGYPIEEHEVTTEDGYILVAHRIPYSPTNENQDKPRPVAILLHGLIACSSDWIIAGPGKGLAYLLSNRGFDVWMLNSRGNYYSNLNTHISEYSFEFWNFSFHEMGIYDLPAWFHYIRNLTGVQKFHYFAHSQGTTDYLVLCSLLPEYNQWIISAHLLAPVAFISNTRSFIFKILGPIFGQPNELLSKFTFNFAQSNDLLHDIVTELCNDQSIFQQLCADILYAIVGYSDYFNESLIPFLTLFYPAGSSDKQGLHYLQNFSTGKFRQYNYGSENLQYYQTSNPPDYNLSNVRVPTYLHYSENDVLATQFDVLRLAVTLPSTVVKGVYKVEPKNWNHLDFLYGNDVDKYVNSQILTDLDQYL